MPIDFPNMQSLERCAEVHKFRKPLPDEEEPAYRTALADHVKSIDLVESFEIRNKVGWDQFSKAQNEGMLRDLGLNFLRT